MILSGFRKNADSWGETGTAETELQLRPPRISPLVLMRQTENEVVRMAQKVRANTAEGNEFLKIYQRLCVQHSSWEVWSDFISILAAAISNAMPSSQRKQREENYLATISRYDKDEQAAMVQLTAATINALDISPWQDFLGDMFMRLELGNHWGGQFFTPYSVCRAMAALQSDDVAAHVEEKGWISVNDCACGAGALLIAFAEACLLKGVNYQNHVVFVAQDIDRTAALMCYIQLSLLGCPGYVVIADTLSNPHTGRLLFPQPKENIWATPTFHSDIWTNRRVVEFLKEGVG